MDFPALTLSIRERNAAVEWMGWPLIERMGSPVCSPAPDQHPSGFEIPIRTRLSFEGNHAYPVLSGKMRPLSSVAVFHAVSITRPIRDRYWLKEMGLSPLIWS